MNRCCEDPGNRADGPGERGMAGVEARPDMVVTHCVVCGCRHFEVQVDAATVGTVGAEL